MTEYELTEEEITGITSSHQVSPFIVRVIAAAEHEATIKEMIAKGWKSPEEQDAICLTSHSIAAPKLRAHEADAIHAAEQRVAREIFTDKESLGMIKPLWWKVLRAKYLPAAPECPSDVCVSCGKSLGNGWIKDNGKLYCLECMERSG